MHLLEELERCGLDQGQAYHSLDAEQWSVVVETREVCLHCSWNGGDGGMEAANQERQPCLAVAASSRVSVVLRQP